MALSFAALRRLGPLCAGVYALGLLAAYLVIGNVTMPLGLAFLGVAIWRVTAKEAPGDRGLEFALQIAAVMGGLLAYTAARHLIEADAAPATRNATAIIDAEAAAGLYFEPRVQDGLMHWEPVIRAFNWFYSFGFLTCVAMAVIWLWVTDARNYRLLRNSLGLSVLPALATIALFPVAPPRLVPQSDLIDTIAYFGREHAFANEFAAVPSLHVGWMALCGVILARTMTGRRAWLMGVLPGALMLLTVIATGNHYWVDGVIGVAYAVGAAVVLTWSAPDGIARVYARGVRRAGLAVSAFLVTCGAILRTNLRAQFTTITLGSLLIYLVGMQFRSPGFTDFWPYLVLQTAAFIVLLVLGEVVFEKQGGLSWLTHVIAVVCTFADVLGTDGNLYNRIDEYDKLTHFLGTAAVTAGIYDVLRALYLRRAIPWEANDRLTLAVALGLAAGVGWEVYELLADKVFGTGRVQGVWDTGNDIMSDALGALGVGGLLWFQESRSRPIEGPETRSDERADGAATHPPPVRKAQ